MNMKMDLGHPILIILYSLALLLLGCAIGIHWHHSFRSAFPIALLGSVLMLIHDWSTSILCFWIAARWARENYLESVAANLAAPGSKTGGQPDDGSHARYGRISRRAPRA